MPHWKTTLLILLCVTPAFGQATTKGTLKRTLDETGFHTSNGERFWSRPLYGPNRRCFVPTGELPHACFLWFQPEAKAFVRCGHCLPGVISPQGTKWLYEAAEVTATYDPGMMRFSVRDPAFEGEIRLELVPLAPGDGYVMRVRASAPVQLAFAFGGFACLRNKDAYQGNAGFSGGLVAGHYRGAEIVGSRDGITRMRFPNLTDTRGQPLNQALDTAFLIDHPAEVSRHEAETGLALADLLRRPDGPASVIVHRVSLEAEEVLNLLIMVSPPEQMEEDLRVLSEDLAVTFDRCRGRVSDISRRITLSTPDTLVDLGARSLSVSMDALWSPPVFLHGPIRWGWPGLVGWRMAYGGDVCGTYDRVASHCQYYGDHRHQGGLDRQPRANPETLLTRQAADSLLFSQGAVVNWGVYNMTEMWLSFVAHHYDWTGDDGFLRDLWPAIRDAVAFEKRALDMDGDSLYENYANTYITDGHWHNGGNCAQASAYMYRGNLLAAQAARLAGVPAEPYLAEATRIRNAMNRVLWIKEKGVYAEWKDVLGEKLRHPEPELGSIYLSIDCGVADEFQAYQMLRYTEWGLPNHMFEEEGPQPFAGFYRQGATYEFPQPMRAREVKSTNWRPIILVTHECSPGEQMDLARAYYRLGLADRAFPLVKAVLRCMVNLTTPGGLVIRDRNTETPSRAWANGDIDHCDTIGPSLQALAEGLFGIHPRRGEDFIEIQPGFPSDWDHARIELRDLTYTFRRQGRIDTFTITTSRPTEIRLRLVLRGDGATVQLNGRSVDSAKIVPGIGHPFIEVTAPRSTSATFRITHDENPLPFLEHAPIAARGQAFPISCRHGSILELKDPQGLFAEDRPSGDQFKPVVATGQGYHTAFLRVRGQATEFWLPIDVEVRPPLEATEPAVAKNGDAITLALQNHTAEAWNRPVTITIAGQEISTKLELAPHATSPVIEIALNHSDGLVPGTNPLKVGVEGQAIDETEIAWWDPPPDVVDQRFAQVFDPLDISKWYNENLALVHTREYLSPRSPYCSLQPATDLYREWCCSGSRPCGELDLGILKDEVTKHHGLLPTPPGIPFRATADGKNIVFVSQWDNFPQRLTIPVDRPARQVYLLMASVTNPMQSGVVNGRVILHLERDETKVLELVNPTNLSWCITHYPHRYGPLYLVQPAIKLGPHVYGTLYSLPLAKPQRVVSLELEAVAIESVIGLMAVTLLPPR